MRFFTNLTIKFFVVFFFLLAVATAKAQTSINADSLLEMAQSAAREGNYSTSRTLARQVLKEAPSYTDAAILLGNTYTWEHKYDSASAVLLPLLTSAPQHAEVYQALAQLAFIKKDNPKTILAYAEQGLAIAPESQELKVHKIKALINLRRYKEAKLLVESLPKEEATYHSLKKLLDESATVNSIRADYQYTTFSTDITDWHLAALDYTRLMKSGSVTGRINYASRFDQSAIQGEIDFWPKLNDKTYLYLNAGYSGSELFPNYRAGLEVYRKLPRSFEASLGARTLVYPKETVWLYTGHIGKYVGKYWAAFRPFIQSLQGKMQVTGILQLRRYFKSSNDYLTLILSKGSTPASQIGLLEISRLDATSVGLESRFGLSNNFYWGALLQFEREEYVEDKLRNRYTTGLSLQYRFK